MTRSRCLSERELELLQPDVPEIIEYLLKTHLISEKKVKTRYVFDNQVYETQIYDPEEVLIAENKLVLTTEDLGVLRMFLKTKNALILHQIPMNKHVFKDDFLVNYILESDRDLVFDLYANPYLPAKLIQDRIIFVRDTYRNIPAKLYDKLFFQNNEGVFINIIPGYFSRLERYIKLVNSDIIAHPDTFLKMIANYSNIAIEEVRECF